MTIRQNVLTALATGSIMLGVLTPLVAADTNVTESGNGTGSNNNVTTSQNNSSTVVQTNNATVNNTVSSSTNSGGNTTNDNTGGDVTVDTGNAVSTTDVTTKANANVADLGNCGCTTNPSNITVSGNGSNSDNNVKDTNTNTSSLFQTNTGYVTNDVTNHANTGNNDTNRNTGGSVLVLTGNAGAQTSLDTALNANVATQSNGNNNGSGDGSSVWITGNGTGSDNTVNLTQRNSATVVQNNEAYVLNKVNNDLNTGYNTTNNNTGGDVTVDTGNALSTTDIKTLANFNAADLGNCGCTTGGGLTLKEAGNGSFTDNNIRANFADTQSVFQTGDANVNNDVYNHHNTGDNNTNRNTGAVTGDPLNVITGYSDAQTSAQTTTNANVFGPNDGFQLPGGMNLNFTFDLNGLLNGWSL